jgi:hypoxanthine phosphoribosyltransferase
VERDIDRILIDRDAIARRIAELADEIRRDLDGWVATAKIVLVPVLTGSIIFVADLMRLPAAQNPHWRRHGHELSGQEHDQPGRALAGELPDDLEGKHVVLSMTYWIRATRFGWCATQIARRNPVRCACACCFASSGRRRCNTPCDYVGFDIPDEFVVGYGLDYDDYYRNLPDIGTLKKEAM